MIANTNVDNLQQYKVRFSLITKEALAFASYPNMVSKEKNLSPKFKQIAWQCFTLLNVFIWIGRSILSLNSKPFHQQLYINSFYIVDITCHFLWINQSLPIFARNFSYDTSFYHAMKGLINLTLKLHDLFWIIYDTYEGWKSKNNFEQQG